MEDWTIPMCRAAATPTAPAAQNLLGIPCWVYGIAFIILLVCGPPAFAFGLFYTAYLDYDDSIHSPVTSQGGDYNAVEVWANKKCYDQGDQMSFRATLTNHTPYEFVAELANEPAFDLIVKVSQEQTKWSDGKPMTFDLTHLRLKPNESRTIELEMIAPYVRDFGGVYASFKLRPSDSPGGFPQINFQVGQCLPGFIGY